MIGYMDKFLVFIGASVVLVPIFHRLGLGSVLGYLTAGILVGDLLVDMGYAPADAELTIVRFIRHDEIMLLEQYKVRKDDKNFVSVTNKSRAQLAEVLSRVSQQSYINPGKV